jgi:hypothetical protein
VRSDEILDYLHAIDEELVPHALEGETLDFCLLGRSALILGFGLSLMTKDVDVVDADNLKLQRKAEELFGKGSPGAARWGFYLETVSSGFPPLPGSYRARSVEIPGSWKVLRPRHLEIHHLAASKLKRFHAKDREDLRILCDTGRMTSEGLRGALESAFAFSADEEEDPGRKSAFENLEVVIEYLEGKRRAI